MENNNLRGIMEKEKLKYINDDELEFRISKFSSYTEKKNKIKWNEQKFRHDPVIGKTFGPILCMSFPAIINIEYDIYKTIVSRMRWLWDVQMETTRPYYGFSRYGIFW